MKNKKYTYYCLGCHREYKTDRCYPYGCICKKCESKVKLTLHCCDCGKEIQISWRTYLSKYPENQHRCSECFAKLQRLRYEVKTDEEKIKQMQPCRDGRQKQLENRTEEDILEESRKKSEGQKKRWDKMSKEDKLKHMQPCKEGYKKFISIEENRLRHNKNTSLGLLRYFENEPLEHKQMRSENGKNQWDRLSEEEYNKLCEYLSKKWYEQNPDERDRRIKLMLDGNAEWRKNLSYDKFLEIAHKKAINCNNKSNKEKLQDIDGPLELEFLNILSENNIPYILHYYNLKEYPNFRNLFPWHPSVETEFISPYHEWDFLIKTKLHNILVDVDGSMHNPKRSHNKYINKYNTLFNDSQRPYMTDGLMAFIVLSYNDKIDNKTKVLQIGKQYPISFKLFMETLHIFNGDRPGENNTIDIRINELENN